MRTLRLIGNIIERLSWVGIVLGGTGIFALVIATVYASFARYLFHAPPMWIGEAAGYTAVWSVAWALAYTQKVRGHIAVDIIGSWLSPRAKAKLNVCVYLIYFAVIVFITWAAFGLMRVSLIEWRLTMVMEYPLFIMHLIISVGLALICLQVMVDLAQAVGTVKSRTEFRATKGSKA